MESNYTIRAGVIPYTVHNDRLYFLFGRDYKTGEICDFGGGRKKNETSKDTAIREFKEETNGIFSKLYSDTCFDRAVKVVCKLPRPKNMIFFLPVKPKWINIAKSEFMQNNKHPNKEITTLVWIDEYQYERLVYKRTSKLKIWEKLRYFLWYYTRNKTTFFAKLKQRFD